MRKTLANFIFKVMTLVMLICVPQVVYTEVCIGVVTTGGGQDFWAEIKKGAQLAAKEIGIKIYVRGSNDEGDIKGQGLAIESMLRLGCGGIVLAPNSSARKKDVKNLKAAGIPTVYIDRDIGGGRIGVIKTDNTLAGAAAAQHMFKALKGKGRVAVLRMSKDVLSTTLREDAFINEANKAGLDVLVGSYLGTTVGSARTQTPNILLNMKDIDGIFTPNESTSLGVIEALKFLKLSGKVVHIGFDSHELMIKSIQNKHMHGVIVQRPFSMGYKAVFAVFNVMQGKNIERVVDTGVDFITIDSLQNGKLMKR